MTTPKRHGNKWNTPEILQLQREYELLELDVSQIATSHQRTVNSILSKLEAEGFIDNWNSARGYNTSFQSEPSNEDLVDRVWQLETNVQEIKGLVSQLVTNLSSSVPSPMRRTRQRHST